MTQTEHTRNEISQLDARAKRKFSFLLALLIVGAILSLFLASLFGRLDIPVAIKMLKHNQGMDKNILDLFRKTSKQIAPLNHPNIVQVFDIEECYQTILIPFDAH